MGKCIQRLYIGVLQRPVSLQTSDVSMHLPYNGFWHRYHHQRHNVSNEIAVTMSFKEKYVWDIRNTFMEPKWKPRTTAQVLVRQRTTRGSHEKEKEQDGESNTLNESIDDGLKF